MVFNLLLSYFKIWRKTIMNKQTKIMLVVLAIFVVGMTLGVAVAEPVSAKKFKKSGYKWKIKDSKWKKLKKQAKKRYNTAKKQGRAAVIGYSNSVKVTVTKNGHKYTGSAMAIKNSKGIRCEVRGVKPGVYISNWGIQRV